MENWWIPHHSSSVSGETLGRTLARLHARSKKCMREKLKIRKKKVLAGTLSVALKSLKTKKDTKKDSEERPFGRRVREQKSV